jgi:hypothetical protein
MTTKEIKLLLTLLGTSSAKIADGIERSRGDVSSAMSGKRDYPVLRGEIEEHVCALIKAQMFDAVWLAEARQRLAAGGPRGLAAKRQRR